jgi:hypothetical protein
MSSSTNVNTSYNVRPDRHSLAEINKLNPEDGVIVFDTDNQVNKFWNGAEWVASGSEVISKTGFIDYNDTSGDVTISSDTWVDVPNNGLGAFTNKTYKPTLINEVLDGSTGYLDFSDLALGSQLLIRNDFTVTPNTNNSLLEVRYLLGQGAGEYALKFWSERLDSGSGIGYQRVYHSLFIWVIQIRKEVLVNCK